MTPRTTPTTAAEEVASKLHRIVIARDEELTSLRQAAPSPDDLVCVCDAAAEYVKQLRWLGYRDFVSEADAITAAIERLRHGLTDV